ncbi:MAG: hypothetical protein LBC98_03520 [Prevotellaceae bacterium]|jgi:hypothetical protein|nr:hypothetical protein [Prevotellaceae bacterium]
MYNINNKQIMTSMRQMYVKLGIVIFALCLVLNTAAKPKYLPAIKNCTQYDLLSKNVSKMKVTVYAPQTNGDKVEPQGLRDFPLELFFDDKGNCVKEIIYDIISSKAAYTIHYEYDTKKGTSGEYCMDSLNSQIWKKIYSVEKDGSIRVKKFERWFNEQTEELIPEMLTYEMVWKEVAADKKFHYVKYRYDSQQTVAMRMEKKYPITEGVSIYDMMDDIDGDKYYVWLPAFMRDYAKAQNKKSRIEEYKLGKTVYTYESKHLAAKNEYNNIKNLDDKSIYKYEFDNKKNWSKLIQYRNDSPVYIVTREIEYK